MSLRFKFAIPCGILRMVMDLLTKYLPLILILLLFVFAIFLARNYCETFQEIVDLLFKPDLIIFPPIPFPIIANPETTTGAASPKFSISTTEEFIQLWNSKGHQTNALITAVLDLLVLSHDHLFETTLLQSSQQSSPDEGNQTTKTIRDSSSLSFLILEELSTRMDIFYDILRDLFQIFLSASESDLLSFNQRITLIADILLHGGDANINHHHHHRHDRDSERVDSCDSSDPLCEVLKRFVSELRKSGKGNIQRTTATSPRGRNLLSSPNTNETTIITPRDSSYFSTSSSSSSSKKSCGNRAKKTLKKICAQQLQLSMELEFMKREPFVIFDCSQFYHYHHHHRRFAEYTATISESDIKRSRSIERVEFMKSEPGAFSPHVKLMEGVFVNLPKEVKKFNSTKEFFQGYSQFKEFLHILMLDRTYYEHYIDLPPIVKFLLDGVKGKPRYSSVVDADRLTSTLPPSAPLPQQRKLLSIDNCFTAGVGANFVCIIDLFIPTSFDPGPFEPVVDAILDHDCECDEYDNDSFYFGYRIFTNTWRIIKTIFRFLLNLPAVLFFQNWSEIVIDPADAHDYVCAFLNFDAILLLLIGLVLIGGLLDGIGRILYDLIVTTVFLFMSHETETMWREKYINPTFIRMMEEDYIKYLKKFGAPAQLDPENNKFSRGLLNPPRDIEAFISMNMPQDTMLTSGELSRSKYIEIDMSKNSSIPTTYPPKNIGTRFQTPTTTTPTSLMSHSELQRNVVVTNSDSMITTTTEKKTEKPTTENNHQNRSGAYLNQRKKKKRRIKIEGEQLSTGTVDYNNSNDDNDDLLNHFEQRYDDYDNSNQADDLEYRRIAIMLFSHWTRDYAHSILETTGFKGLSREELEWSKFASKYSSILVSTYLLSSVFDERALNTMICQFVGGKTAKLTTITTAMRIKGGFNKSLFEFIENYLELAVIPYECSMNTVKQIAYKYIGEKKTTIKT